MFLIPSLLSSVQFTAFHPRFIKPISLLFLSNEQPPPIDHHASLSLHNQESTTPPTPQFQPHVFHSKTSKRSTASAIMNVINSLKQNQATAIEKKHAVSHSLHRRHSPFITRLINLFGKDPQLRRRNISFSSRAPYSLIALVFHLERDHVRLLRVRYGRLRQPAGHLACLLQSRLCCTNTPKQRFNRHEPWAG